MKRLKLPFLYFLSFVASCLPLLVYFFLNLDKYVKTTPQAVKITFGFAILLVIFFVKLIGKLRMPHRVVTFSILIILSYLLESLLNDLVIFLFLALLGEVQDLILQSLIRRERDKRDGEKMSSEIEKSVENALKRINRV